MVYTGIVQAVGKAFFKGFRLHVKGPKGFFNNSNHGDSVGINGVCLTLEDMNTDEDTGVFFVMEETRNLTNLYSTIPSVSPEVQFDESQTAEVNLEHSLRVGDSIGGHTVAGHVSGVAPIINIQVKEDQSWFVWFDLSGFGPELLKLVVHKVSFCT
jgi:riboflavin synthase